MKLKFFFFIFLLFISNLLCCQSKNLTSILTKEEIEWLKNHKDNIRYAPNPSWPPGDYIENGVHKGYVADYIKIFEKELGIKFKRVYFKNWSEIINGLKTSKVDLVGAIEQTPERTNFLSVTEPFIYLPVGIIVRKNYPHKITERQINKMKLACIKDYITTDYIKTNYPGATIVEVEDDLTALIKTSFELADGAVVDFMVASYLVDKYGISNLEYGTMLNFTWKLGFGVRKEYEILTGILNKIIKNIPDEKKAEIYNKWVTIKKPSFFERNWLILLIGAIFILIVLFLSVLFNYFLNRLVKIKTEELRIARDIALENEQKYRLLVENQTDFLIKLDPEGRFLFISPSFCKLFDKNEEELIYKNFISIVFPDDIDTTKEFFEHLHKKPHKAQLEHRILTKDGSRWLEWIYTPLLEENEKIFSIIGLGRDITEKKIAEEKLKKSLEEKQTLIKELYHRTRNNMNVIQSMLIMHSLSIKDENLKQILIDISNRINAMALVHQKLYKSQNLSYINLTDYVSELFQSLSNSFNINKDKISFEVNKTYIPVIIDIAIPCGLILNEFFTNSIKYAFPDGRKGLISVNITKEVDIIIIKYSDNGVGLPKNFDLNKQEGIGLKLIRTIVEYQLKGTVDLNFEGGFSCTIKFKDENYKERVAYENINS